MNIQHLEVLLRKWQTILRLQDWDIRLQQVTTPWRKTGDIKIDLEDHKAVMLINMNKQFDNQEELVVHELVHLKLFGMDQIIEELIGHMYGTDESDPKREFAYTVFMKELESTVEDLTKGFLAAANVETPLAFNRLDKQIKDELSPEQGD